jgi:hypothetical protein
MFHLQDPFATQGRVLDPEKYALDRLLQSNDTCVLEFLAQLKFELNKYQR